MGEQVKKRWKIDLKFGNMGRTAPVLADFMVTDVSFENETPSQYGYIIFTGTQQEFDAVYDKLSGHENRFKIIGTDSQDLPETAK